MDAFDTFLHIGIPIYLLYIFIGIALLLFICVKFWGENNKIFYYTLMSECVIAVILKTVVYRPHTEMREDTYPFWSYIAGFDGKPALLAQIVLNVLLFIPIGFLLRCCSESKSVWITFLVGLCLSGLIETLQFLFEKGLPEVDDLFHNSLGCVLGYYLYQIILVIRKK